MSIADKFEPVLQRLASTDYGDHVAKEIRAALASNKGVHTMRAWMQSNNGKVLTTVQITNATGQVWAPTGRTIDAVSKASYVTLSGSRRDYAGMHAAGMTDTAFIVADEWHTIAYVIEENSRWAVR